MSAALRRIAALGAASLALAWAAPAGAIEEGEFDKFAIESVSAGLSDKQAGAHADMTIAIKLTRDGNAPYANAKDIEIELPPGVIGDPQATPRCTTEQLGPGPESSVCPFESQVGISLVRTLQPFPFVFNEPVYNMVAPKGTDIVARIGFIAGAYPALVNLRVDPTDYSIIATAEGLPSATGLSEATTTVWGVPSDPIHDPDRITPEEAVTGETPPTPRSVTPGGPFLSNPTDCSTQREVRVSARSYQLPESPSVMSAPFPPITGCGNVKFAPTFTATLTNPEAAAPSGLDTELIIPQDETPQGNATSTLKSARVTLPAGFAINPAAAEGLAACSAEQVGYGKNVAAECPDAAKIGSIEAEVPALEETLHGSVYQRTPEPGRLFGFWVVADGQGVHLKLPAEIQANPLSGQITTVFNGIESLGGLPQVPFSALRLNVFSGPRAPLATPAACGTYFAEYSFAPWSGRPPLESKVPLPVTQGCEKGGFAPKLVAGSLIPTGGKYTPFAFTLSRSDGEANPAVIALHMPKGLLAKLAGVPLCPEAAAPTGACPAASRLGSLAAASGVGGAPLWLPQPGKAPTAAYLAGPYKGAPYSVISVVPAQAGPFDLGVVVNRAAIHVDPESALATIVTDPLPQILEGVPVSYRTLHVLVDRPEFTLNPTSCKPKQISATVTAASGAVATPSDGFQATGCAKLRYRPKLKLSFKGSTRRSGHPAVKAVLTQKPGQANTAAATVILPPSLFIDQDHINNPCTRVQFNAGECPKLSILGRATARTPLLDESLSGPVYFRSNGGERELPDIVADLHGPIHVTLVGFVDAVTKKGSETSRIRTRFASVPDAPVSRFEMRLLGGKKRGLLENSRDLCKSKPRVDVRLRAQNGRSRVTKPRIGLPCGKRKRR